MSNIFEDVIKGKYKNIWIYGAGKVGKKLLKDFNFFHIKVNGIVISRYDGTVIPGIKVCGLAEIKTLPEDTVYIITSSPKFHNEIIENIKMHGFKHYIIWDAKCLCRLWKLAEYDFTDRRTHTDKCCFILAGYKEFLWENVFGRFARFMPDGIDVCIISSGLHSEKLEKLAAKNRWSYLATRINSVTLAQNIAFSIFNNYEWVYKADEDIFVTKGVFEALHEAYQKGEKELPFLPGITAPLIPVNGYGYGRILDRLGMQPDYESRFGKITIGGNPDSEIEKNPEAAVFMWTKCPQIDELNSMAAGYEGIDLCGVRFSIGFILLKHSLWEDMQGFHVSGNADMGTDEEDLCSYCINKSRVIMVSTNKVVGHFAFGRQTGRMKEVYAENPGLFKIREL